jgi:3-(3-hydroxy-phenyl)propionate hydroxylase
MEPGAPATDAPVRRTGEDAWFLAQTGNGFTGIYFSDGGELSEERLDELRSLSDGPGPVNLLRVEPQGVEPRATAGIPVLEDAEGLAAKRYDARPGTFYLLRPDQHVCARWRDLDVAAVRAALARATGHA